MASPILAPILRGSVIEATDFVIAEWQDSGVEGRRPIAPLHLHRRDDEAWYVLEGALGVQVGDSVVEAHRGAAVLAPRGTPHTYWNAGSGLLRYLLIMTPNTNRLIQAIHAASDRSPAAMRELFLRFDSELV
jgi:mannose-6-phosphate isomerase-like protein (cupin superfamily)